MFDAPTLGREPTLRDSERGNPRSMAKLGAQPRSVCHRIARLPQDGHRYHAPSLFGMKLSRRSRWILGAASVCVLVLGGVAFLNRGPSIVIPDHPCADPPPLRTHDGVTLQPVAMRAFHKAERIAHTTIAISASFRSCAQQAIACRNICGNPQGCPGRCATPGSSWHQLGAAVDLTQGSLDNATIVSAMKSAGWCEPLPSSDPGHFSYGGCH
jgi:hypothetical protein